MKQLLQSLASGKTDLSEMPCPSVPRGSLLIRSSCSLVSAGTERMLVDFGKANWLDKARLQPDKFQQVFDKARSDGVFHAFEAVQSKLDQAIPLGYSNVGSVVAIVRTSLASK